jgi:hypothetical protein
MQATDEEWQEYYRRADRMRTRRGDPFMKLIARQERRQRLFRIGMTVLAVTTMVVVVSFGVWLGSDLNFEAIFEMSTS